MRSGRTAVVTGAARGIGAAVARSLAARGNAVALVDLDERACRSVSEDILDDGGSAVAVVADVGDEASVADAMEQVNATLGPPTLLVNNAGVLRDGRLADMTVQDWDTVLAVHGRGAFLMSRAVQGGMVAARWGRIINISSIAALGSRAQANYSAAKAALHGLTKTLAIELGPFGITVNAVAPGFIETDMPREVADRRGISYSELASRSAARTPVGRIGHPADVVAAVMFFSSEAASFTSGQVLHVAGGPAA